MQRQDAYRFSAAPEPPEARIEGTGGSHPGLVYVMRRCALPAGRLNASTLNVGPASSRPPETRKECTDGPSVTPGDFAAETSAWPGDVFMTG